jgi:radical SAM superfamily enzyme YgiQ (UPF0313 family)
MTTERTLLSEYRHFPALQFFGSAPTKYLPPFLFNLLSPTVTHTNGILTKAPYGLRKIEANLSSEYGDKNIVVVHPDYLDHFIDSDTKIVAVEVMDPLGYGPLSLMLSRGSKLTVQTKFNFLKLARKISKIKNINKNFKTVIGGPGSWQLTYRRELLRRMKIDHIIIGDADHLASSLFKNIEQKNAEDIVITTPPSNTDKIPLISKPSMHGLVEVMRGCGRMCQYCEPTMKSARYVPVDNIKKEVQINTKNGNSTCLIHSEDIFLYKLEDIRNFMPNEDAILELFREIMSVNGITSCNLTHGTVSGVVSNPRLVSKLSKILNSSANNYIKLLCGLETGSVNMVSKYMPLKPKPFSPEEWPEIICEGTAIMNKNYWFPLYTIITGMPGETEEDVWDTLRLIDRMEKELPRRVGKEKAHFIVTPLCFIPLGVLKKSEFFNIEDGLTEARVLLLYRAWLHNFREATQIPPSLFKNNHIINLLLKYLLKSGNGIANSFLERWVKKLGFDPNNAINLSNNI